MSRQTSRTAAPREQAAANDPPSQVTGGAAVMAHRRCSEERIVHSIEVREPAHDSLLNA